MAGMAHCFESHRVRNLFISLEARFLASLGMTIFLLAGSGSHFSAISNPISSCHFEADRVRNPACQEAILPTPLSHFLVLHGIRPSMAKKKASEEAFLIQ